MVGPSGRVVNEGGTRGGVPGVLSPAMTGERHNLRVVRSGCDRAQRMAAELAAPGWRDASVRIKTEGDSFVARVTLAGRDSVVKLRTLRSADRLKALVGHGRGERQWEGAERLIASGIPAARPLALFRGLLDGDHVELFVAEFVPGPTLLRCLAADDWEGAGRAPQRALAAAAGRSVAALHGAGLFNRDHKPSNLIVRDGPGDPVVVVLDTVAIRADGSDHAVARMLASLVIEPTGVGLAGRLRRSLLFRGALAGAADDRDRARRLYRAAAVIVREHADPTPRVNPLAGARPGE
jgi:hypothetical protein